MSSQKNKNTSQRLKDFFKKAEEQKLDEVGINLDESHFIFTFQGGKSHTEFIQVQAFFRSGIEKDQPVPILCKWYNVNNETKEVVEIQGVTGAFYQPCAEDIGLKIQVQATPILDRAGYVGMPLTANFGPLEVDQSIQDDINEFLESGKCTILSVVEEIHDENVNEIRMGKDCVLKLNNEQIQIDVKSQGNILYTFNQELSANYPLIKILKQTNNFLDLFLNEKTWLRIATKNNLQRDILVLSLRSFVGQKIIQLNLNQSIDSQEEKNLLNNQNKEEQTQIELKEEQQKENQEEIQQSKTQEQIQIDIQNQETFLDQKEENLEIQKQESDKQEQSYNNEHTEKQENLNNQEFVLNENIIEKIVENKQNSQNSQLSVNQAQIIYFKEQENQNNTIQQQNSGNQNNMDVLIKIQKLNQKLLESNNQNETLKKEINNIQEQLFKSNSSKETLEEQMNNLSKNYFELQKRNKILEQNNQELQQEQLFFIQELMLQKQKLENYEELQKQKPTGQIQLQIENLKNKKDLLTINELENENLNLKEQIKQLMQDMEENERIFKERLKTCQVQYNVLLKEKLKEFQFFSPNRNDQQNENNLEEKIEIQNFNLSNSNLGNISQQNSTIYNLSRQNSQGHYESPNNLNFSKLEDEHFLLLKDEIYNKMKSQILFLNSTLNSMKKAYDRDITNKQKKFLINFGEYSDNSPYQIQKLANNLAETITEKQMELKDQKYVNKCLIEQNQQLQDEIKDLKLKFAQLQLQQDQI